MIVLRFSMQGEDVIEDTDGKFYAFEYARGRYSET